MSTPDRYNLLDRGHPGLSIRRQCALLGVARSGVYRARKPANDNDLGLMRRASGRRAGRRCAASTSCRSSGGRWR